MPAIRTSLAAAMETIQEKMRLKDAMARRYGKREWTKRANLSPMLQFGADRWKLAEERSNKFTGALQFHAVAAHAAHHDAEGDDHRLATHGLNPLVILEC